jgi:rhamnogalacturonan endolyase
VSSFGLTSDSNFFTVNTGAGLVFKVRRVDNGSSTQSVGDLASIVYNGVEYQDQTRGTQINSGFDYLYNGVSAVTVDAVVVNTNYIKVTVRAGNLTHYYMVQNGSPNIYMGTYFSTEPDILNLVRFIVRVPISVLPNGPAPSNLRGNTGAIESSDVFGMSNGETRSKHYSNMRLKDWTQIGATSGSVGVWVVRDNNEGGSGGPFFRCLLNQATDTNQEITYIVNYGEGQTEAFRPNVLNTYTMVFNNGATPGPLDTSWFANMGLTGFIPSTGRGGVTGVGINGRVANYTYTVGFSNSTAQYWATASASDGSFNLTGMIPGVYTMKVYKNELAVDTRSVTVTAGGTASVSAITIGNDAIGTGKWHLTSGDPSVTPALFRIGDWDGSPQEFINGSKLTTMHPSDSRMSSWYPSNYVVGTSQPSTGFPAYQWKGTPTVPNAPITVKFDLTAAQISSASRYVLRMGVTAGQSGARPQIKVNNWTSGFVGSNSSDVYPPAQPTTRMMTVGTYRGVNVTYDFTIPYTQLVAGTNTLQISVVSGSSSTSTWLSPGYSIDAVDLIKI